MRCPKCNKEMPEIAGRIPALELPFVDHRGRRRGKTELGYHYVCCGSTFVKGLALLEVNMIDNTRIKAW